MKLKPIIKELAETVVYVAHGNMATENFKRGGNADPAIILKEATRDVLQTAMNQAHRVDEECEGQDLKEYRDYLLYSAIAYELKRGKGKTWRLFMSYIKEML